MSTRGWIRCAMLLAILHPLRLPAQARIEGVVVDSLTGSGLDRARVWVEYGQAIFTDRFGRFSLSAPSFPARIIVARIGWRPDTLTFLEPPFGRLRVVLGPAPVTIADLAVRAGERTDPALGEMGRWVVPKDGRGPPPVVTRDVLRELATLPAVTQSIVSNARPLVRGYDAGEVTLLLDGFDLPAPYHLARAFSSLPAQAVEQTSLVTAPLDPSIGGTTGAAIDVTGRTGGGPGKHSGLGVSPVAIDAWLGGGRGVRAFAAGRITTVPAAAKLAGKQLWYGFHDAYGSLLLSPGGMNRIRFTAFFSGDSADIPLEYAWMRWGTSLIGVRTDLWHRGGTRFELSASHTSSAQVVRNLINGNGLLNVDNRFSRTGFGLEWNHTGDRTRAVLGITPAWRTVENRVVSNGSSVADVEQDVHRREFGAYGALSHPAGPLQVDWGVRLDAAGANRRWQPRLRVGLPLGAGLGLEGGVGRSARLQHSVTDTRAMPELLLYDLWLESGRNGIPVAEIDHASLAITWRRGPLSVRSGAYASRGRGIVEIRPETDQRAVRQDFRTGRSRTRGVEWQGALSGARNSVTATYALTWSERDWGGGWIPWRQDRRHLVRTTATSRLWQWRISVLTEFLSAAPLTPVDYIGTVGDDQAGRAVYIYGAENSGRGAPTFRADLAMERQFGGPWGSTGAFTFSVTNLNFGPASPVAPLSPLADGFDGSGGVPYARLFDMPAIPSFGLRFEF